VTPLTFFFHFREKKVGWTGAAFGRGMVMSVFLKLMVGGWGTAFAMFGFFALKESGKLLEMHKRIGLWLETFNSSGQPDRRELANRQ
jgi:hypothetical protein